MINNIKHPDNAEEYQLVDNAECPKCKRPSPDSPSPPWVKHPIYCNYYSSLSPNGHFFYWDEYHKCDECGTKYWFNSSN